jgi:hypothetical protein
MGRSKSDRLDWLAFQEVRVAKLVAEIRSLAIPPDATELERQEALITSLKDEIAHLEAGRNMVLGILSRRYGWLTAKRQRGGAKKSLRRGRSGRTPA